MVDKSLVCKLNKALYELLYELKQVPRQWFTRLHNTLHQFGFVNNTCYTSLFIYKKYLEVLLSPSLCWWYCHDWKFCWPDSAFHSQTSCYFFFKTIWSSGLFSWPWNQAFTRQFNYNDTSIQIYPWSSSQDSSSWSSYYFYSHMVSNCKWSKYGADLFANPYIGQWLVHCSMPLLPRLKSALLSILYGPSLHHRLGGPKTSSHRPSTTGRSSPGLLMWQSLPSALRGLVTKRPLCAFVVELCLHLWRHLHLWRQPTWRTTLQSGSHTTHQNWIKKWKVN